MELINKLQKKFGGKGYGKYIGTRYIYKLLPLTRKSWCNYEGMKLYIGKIDNAGYSFLDFEFYERNIIKKHINKGDYVLDLGANIGLYTCLFSKWVGKTGKVFSFEPELTNFNILKDNVKRNNCNNVILFNKAVSDITREGVLLVSEHIGEHSLYHRDNFTVNNQKVDIIKLDDLKFEKVNFIKMDIEGGEAHALRGMTKLISRFSPIIFTEINPPFMKNNDITPEQFVKELKDLNYNLEWVNQSNNIREVDSNSNVHTNILCIRKQ